MVLLLFALFRLNVSLREKASCEIQVNKQLTVVGPVSA